MITTVTLGSITLTCGDLRKPQTLKISQIGIPGRNGDIIQSMGKNSKRIELSGILSGNNKDTDKTTLEGYLNTTQTYNDGVDNMTVFVENVDIPTVGGQPNHYIFTINLIEYIQT